MQGDFTRWFLGVRGVEGDLITQEVNQRTVYSRYSSSLGVSSAITSAVCGIPFIPK